MAPLNKRNQTIHPEAFRDADAHAPMPMPFLPRLMPCLDKRNAGCCCTEREIQPNGLLGRVVIALTPFSLSWQTLVSFEGQSVKSVPWTTSRYYYSALQ